MCVLYKLYVCIPVCQPCAGKSRAGMLFIVKCNWTICCVSVQFDVFGFASNLNQFDFSWGHDVATLQILSYKSWVQMKVVFLKGSVKCSFVQQDVTRSYCIIKNFVWCLVIHWNCPYKPIVKHIISTVNFGGCWFLICFPSPCCNSNSLFD